MDKLKILYIAGVSRSGSTILCDTLGQLDSFFSVGELAYVWERDLNENRFCTCGARFRECSFWRAVFERAFDGMSTEYAREMIERRRRLDPAHYIPLRILPALEERLMGRRLRAYSERLMRLYHAIREVSGCRVIVDSSKSLSHGRTLSRCGNVDLYVVNLVRDPRAIAYSWRRKKRHLEGGYFRVRNPLRVAVGWSAAQVLARPFAAGRAKGFLDIRYEDFVARPREALNAILVMMGEPPQSLPVTGDHAVNLEAGHGAGGNPSKSKLGEVALVADDEWKAAMQPAHRAIVTALTMPLLLKYRYELNPAPAVAK